MTEQKIYDEFESASRAVLDKARADAAAIGADINSIIGQVDKVEATVGKGAGVFWNFLSSLLQFLDGPNGKFSHKRLIALAASVVSIIELFRGNGLEAAGCAIVAVVLAVISAITKT
jgi:hypothetical protein